MGLVNILAGTAARKVIDQRVAGKNFLLFLQAIREIGHILRR